MEVEVLWAFISSLNSVNMDDQENIASLSYCKQV